MENEKKSEIHERKITLYAAERKFVENETREWCLSFQSSPSAPTTNIIKHLSHPRLIEAEHDQGRGRESAKNIKLRICCASGSKVYSLHFEFDRNKNEFANVA